MTATLDPVTAQTLRIGTLNDPQSTCMTLPLQAAASRFVLLGKSGAGKTNGDTVFAEEFIRAGIPTFILDPLGNMWGLRSSPDGTQAGLPVVILGGQHADVPIGPADGRVVAEILAERGSAAVIDVSEFSIAEQRGFAEAFCGRLLQVIKRVVHVVLEEADRFAPNTIGRNDVKTFARTARNFSIGWTFSSQRPQILSPEVIETSSAIIAMKMTGELAQEAIGSEVRSRLGKALMFSILADLPKMKRGEAWFVPDPDWLPDQDEDFEAEPHRFRFRLRETFDSAKPPSIGTERIEPKVIAPVDLASIRAALAQPDDDDAEDEGEPELIARIAELEEQLAVALEPLPASEPERIEVPVLTDADRALLETIAEQLKLAREKAYETVLQYETARDRAVELINAITERVTPYYDPPPQTLASKPRPSPAEGNAPPVRAADNASGAAALQKAHRAVLAAIAQHKRLSKVQAGILSGYSPGSGHFGNVLGTLRALGYITKGEPIEITPAGLAAAGDIEPLPTGAALRTYWLNKITKAERALLSALINAYPRALTKEQLGEKSGYSSTSGHFGNSLGKLRSLDLAIGQGTVRAADALFTKAPA